MMAIANNSSGAANDGAIDPLIDYIIEQTGLSYYRCRVAELAGHIQCCMTEANIRHFAQYHQRLQAEGEGRDLMAALIERLTIGETYFFRNAPLFESLEQSILPKLIQKNQEKKKLRIWSAGASIGAEAYSVSILLRRKFGHLLKDWKIEIVGTDINRQFLASAAKAEFGDWALRGIDPDIRDGCFTQQGKSWLLRPEYRQGVSFRFHNLVEEPIDVRSSGLWDFDVILCRNVMIYFSPAVTDRLVALSLIHI